MTAKKYDEVDVSAWNVKHFTDYLCDEHLKHYGINYQPNGGWAKERGLIGNLIGTARKKGTTDREFLKTFIDACFREHRVSPQYPGASFTWFYTYKKSLWQRIQAEEARKATSAKAIVDSDNDKLDELERWL